MSNLLKIKVSKVFSQTIKAKSKIVLNIGGARSGKSYAMAQLLIMKALNYPGLNIGIARKTMPALKMTARRLVLDLLKQYGLYQTSAFNKTENYYQLNKSRLQFFSLDDPEKIKSTEFNYLWLEEATDFTYQDYLVLLTRLSAPTKEYLKNQIFLTLNPTDINCWIAKYLLNQKDVCLIKSTYKDNKFLSKDYIETLLSLKDYNKQAYKIFALGEWGSSETLIYTNWQMAEQAPNSYDEIFWGLDFGFNNPTALVKIFVKDKIYFIEEKLYKTHLTNTLLIEELKTIIPEQERSQIIYADSAEPDRIAEISSAGFNIKPALKSVLDGIMFVKSCALNIIKVSPNLIKEIQSYSWKTTLNGQLTEDPIKYNDHALDALRYGLYTHKTHQGHVAQISFI
ncbi:MAG: PBSX family phage terminase large subunit [Elusimicrobiaceae bacterium]|nr:PBSX family phage terminase large subunit [Elusimicrobiaceae bacterium]